MEETELKFCPECGCDVFAIKQILLSGPHYSSFRCPDCNKFLGFGKKPVNEGKRGKNKHSPKSLGIDHCQMCLRPSDRLGTRGVLEAHHVQEIQEDGPDIPGNIWVVCTSCHQLIHHQRTYLNRHLSNYYSAKELQDDMEKYNIPAETQAVMRRLFDKYDYPSEA
ncbi:MAG TPA: hypothetical protein DCS09_03890 [Porphyromonadaceae bacterium]|nr:hypothetical protein [Porphyromonadaceae bacterium]